MGVLLNVILKSWVLEEVSVTFNGVSFYGSLGIDFVPWVLLEIKLNTWVLKDGIIVFSSSVLKGIVVELDTWLLSI